MNPNKDVVIAAHLDGDPLGPTTDITLPAHYFDLPDYKRKYNALEMKLEKSTDKWALQGSYTLSRTYGNVEGYANSTYGDGGLYVAHSIDFNHSVVQQGSYGDLPNDRTHQLKLYGHYNLSEEWTVGGNAWASSGRPRNCRGASPYQYEDLRNGLNPDGVAYDPDDIPDEVDEMQHYGRFADVTNWCREKPYDASWEQFDPDTGELVATHYYTAFAPVLHNSGDMGRTPWVWNFDFSVSYKPRWAGEHLKIQMDVYNLFNRHGVIAQNDNHDTVLLPSDGIGATRAVPGPGIDPADPRISTAYGGHGQVHGPSPNYGQTTGFQSPRYVQFSLRYDW